MGIVLIIVLFNHCLHCTCGHAGPKIFCVLSARVLKSLISIGDVVLVKNV